MNDQAHHWRNLAARLGFRVEAPATLDLGGESVSFNAWLPEFGGRSGMIAEPDGNFLRNHWDALIARGYGFSAVTIDSEPDDESAREMLRDWGWASGKPAPEWW